MRAERPRAARRLPQAPPRRGMGAGRLWIFSANPTPARVRTMRWAGKAARAPEHLRPGFTRLQHSGSRVGQPLSCRFCAPAGSVMQPHIFAAGSGARRTGGHQGRLGRPRVSQPDCLRTTNWLHRLAAPAIRLRWRSCALASRFCSCLPLSCSAAALAACGAWDYSACTVPAWAVSSVGRASRLHREGRRFEPVTAHQARRFPFIPPRP